jgi:hypothetical protein
LELDRIFLFVVRANTPTKSFWKNHQPTKKLSNGIDVTLRDLQIALRKKSIVHFWDFDQLVSPLP